MPKLTGLGEVLNNFDGTPLKGLKDVDLTFKDVLVGELSAYQGEKNASDSLMRAYDLGLKIFNADTEIDLDNDQVKFLEKVVGANPLGYVAIVLGNLLHRIDEAKMAANAKKADGDK